MLSQEFPLPEVLRIWDSILSDETRWTNLTKYNFKVCLTIQYFKITWNILFVSVQFLWAKVTDKASIKNSITNSITNSKPNLTYYRSDFLLDVCTAMLTLVRKEILSNEFPDNMKLLQVNKNYYCWYEQLEKKSIETSLENLFKSVKPKQDKTTKSLREHWSNKTFFINKMAKYKLFKF